MEPRSNGGMKNALISGAALLLALGVVALVHRSRSETPVTGAPRPGVPAPPSSTRDDVPLQVISERDNSPISGAVLTFKDGAGAEARVTTDRQGMAVLPKGAHGSLVIKAAGHVGAVNSLPWSRADGRVTLVPSGSLVIRFTDRDERPVPGVEVDVLPGDGRESAELLSQPVAWRQTSNADGQATWPELVPGAGCRWTLHSPHYVGRSMPEEMGLEEPRSNTPDERGDTIPDHRSSPFEVRPGVEVRLTAIVSRSGSVSGILAPAGMPGASGWAKVYHLREYVGDNGKVESTRLILEAIVRTDRGGAFKFRSLRPGNKRVVAQWQDRGKAGFDMRVFDLHPGEEKSLGTLRGVEELSVPIIVRVKCDEKLRSELTASGPLEAVIRFSTRASSGGALPANLFNETMVLNIDEPKVVQGIPAGELLAEAWIRKETPGVRWKKSGMLKFTLPAAGPIELTLEATQETSIRVTAAYPTDQPSCPLQVFFFPDGLTQYGFEGPAIPAPAGASKESSVPCTVPPGNYTVLVLTRSGTGVAAQNYFAEARLRVEDGQRNELRVNLVPGAILKGRVVDTEAMPVKKPLYAKIEPFNRARDPFVFSLSSDADGRFTLVGIPPGRDLRFPSFENDITAGAAGSETTVQVEVEH